MDTIQYIAGLGVLLSFVLMGALGYHTILMVIKESEEDDDA